MDQGTLLFWLGLSKYVILWMKVFNIGSIESTILQS